MHPRQLTPLFCGLVLLLACPVLADHDDSTPGQPPSWDANLIYVGTFPGNDNDGSVSAAVGHDVMQVDKVDAPATMSGDLTISCTGGCASESGTWSYTGTHDLEYLVIKGGPNFAVYEITNGATSGNWETSDLVVGNGNHPDISHVSVYKDNTMVSVEEQPWSLIKRHYR